MRGRWIFKNCVSSWVFTSMSMCQFQKVCSLQVFPSDPNRHMIYIYTYFNHHHTHIQHIPNLMILQPHWTCWWFQGRNLWNLWPWHWLCHLPSGAKAQMVGMHPRKLTWNLKMMVFHRNLLFRGDFFSGSMLVFGEAIKILGYLDDIWE